MLPVYVDPFPNTLREIVSSLIDVKKTVSLLTLHLFSR